MIRFDCKYILLLSFCFLFIINTLYSQADLYIPLEIQKACGKGTRTTNGEPGRNYWQNSSDYKIRCSVDPITRLLIGTETVIYYNNSPDSLSEIVIRLYQNINKAGSQKDFVIKPEALNDGMKINYLIVNNLQYDLNDIIRVEIKETNLIITLKEKIAPQSNIELKLGWEFIIPKGNNIRMGTYSDSTFFVGYWYPQIAVYDDVYGWDKIDYTGQAEFYNDFSDFDVEITVPADLTIWSTGVLQNVEKIFTQEYQKRYNKALKSDTIIHIFAKEDLSKKRFFSEDSITWHFKAEDVPDFAFAMSNKYLWDAVSVDVEDREFNRVLINVAFDPQSKDFYEVAAISKYVIEQLSTVLPGIPFPYPCMTVFNGEGGMEYPMIVNNGSSGTRWGTVHLAAHEITHTYFPFYMGINERRFGWMDEGWAVMLPYEIEKELEPENNPIYTTTFTYKKFAGTESDIPPITPSYLLNGNAYRMAVYNRPALAYYFLRDLLGKVVFEKALRKFINTWNKKHPVPYDFFYSFNKNTGEDLSWFWKPWFFENAYPDLALKKAELKNGKLKILVEKVGTLPIPVSLTIYLENGKTTDLYKTAKIWSKGTKEVWIEMEVEDKVSYLQLGNPVIPDINKGNDFLNMEKSSTL